MSSRIGDSNESNRYLATREAEQLIQDLAELESGLALEVRRLERLSAPRPGPLPAYRGRPVWWWRVKLLRWAWSRPTERRNALDALHGLRLVLAEWNDEQLVRHVEHVRSTAFPSSAA